MLSNVRRARSRVARGLSPRGAARARGRGPPLALGRACPPAALAGGRERGEGLQQRPELPEVDKHVGGRDQLDRAHRAVRDRSGGGAAPAVGQHLVAAQRQQVCREQPRVHGHLVAARCAGTAKEGKGQPQQTWRARTTC